MSGSGRRSPAGEVQLLNRPLLEYFGKTSTELNGWALSDAVHPDDLPRVIVAFTKELLEKFGISAGHIVKAVKSALG